MSVHVLEPVMELPARVPRHVVIVRVARAVGFEPASTTTPVASTEPDTGTVKPPTASVPVRAPPVCWGVSTMPPPLAIEPQKPEPTAAPVSVHPVGR